MAEPYRERVEDVTNLSPEAAEIAAAGSAIIAEAAVHLDVKEKAVSQDG